jgi:hypothetical protein
MKQDDSETLGSAQLQPDGASDAVSEPNTDNGVSGITSRIRSRVTGVRSITTNTQKTAAAGRPDLPTSLLAGRLSA